MSLSPFFYFGSHFSILAVFMEKSIPFQMDGRNVSLNSLNLEPSALCRLCLARIMGPEN